MMYKKQCSAYGVARETVSKIRQVVMLYDGMIKFTMLAGKAIEENRIEDRFTNLERAGKIMMGLQSCLDFEQGGKIAHVLFLFYTTMHMRLLGLNQSRSVQECDAIIKDLQKMRDTWEEISKSNLDGNDTEIPTAGIQENLAAKLESIAVSI